MWENTLGLLFSLENFDCFLCRGTISASFNSLWNFEERIKALISWQMYLAKKAAFFKECLRSYQIFEKPFWDLIF